ncbi:MAG: hypothetical protein ACEPOW_06060 [Bacteroidales bacterium]
MQFYKRVLNKLVLLLIFILPFSLISNAQKPATLSQEHNQNFKEGTRQIHLDFHNSEYLKDIGKHFDKKQFQEALIAGKVNSINLFAKGHHGWSYYPTKVGHMHPNLNFDLLKAEIEACHEIGVKVCAYYPIGWSQNDYKLHPEWAMVNKEGHTYTQQGQPLPIIKKGDENKPLPYTYWTLLSPERGYLDLILAQTKEILDNYDVDGIWYDIVNTDGINYSKSSIADMKKNHINPENTAEASAYFAKKMKKFFDQTSDLVEKIKPGSSVFYNWTTAFRYETPEKGLQENSFKYAYYNYNTKEDLEDLPTTWDGYDVFPMRAKFFLPLGKDIVAMSGKFHTAWGEFGGFKAKEAIKYEAASMVAFGANCNFGDQLHPSGIMDMSTYRNIGYAYDYVEKIEDYGVGAQDVANLGVILTFDTEYDEGVTRMLLEEHIDFLVLNNISNWDNIETIILNGANILSGDMLEKLKAFQARGGKILALGKGGLDQDQKEFAIDLGVDYQEHSKFDIDYTIIEDSTIVHNLPRSPFLNYESAIVVKPKKGTKVLAGVQEPYFSRTLKHYTSHRNTPYKLERAEYPSVVLGKNTAYIAYDLGKQYFDIGAKVHRDLFRNVLNLVYKNPMVATNIKNLPSEGRINLLKQPEHNRYVVHILYASPIQRGIARVIEDMPPIYDIPLTLNVPEKVTKVYTIPDKQELEFSSNGNLVQLIVPKVQCHNAIVFEYEK